jgi:hypothetical protein
MWNTGIPVMTALRSWTRFMADVREWSASLHEIEGRYTELIRDRDCLRGEIKSIEARVRPMLTAALMAQPEGK